MNFLLDTHILIWAAISPHKISSELAILLSDPSNHLYFSSASIWEISTQESLGKSDFLARRMTKRYVVHKKYRQTCFFSEEWTKMLDNFPLTFEYSGRRFLIF